MMDSKTGLLFDNILNEFSKLELEFKQEREEALDEDNMDFVKEIHSKIRKIKGWKEDLNRISEEIEHSNLLKNNNSLNSEIVPVENKQANFVNTTTNKIENIPAKNIENLKIRVLPREENENTVQQKEQQILTSQENKPPEKLTILGRTIVTNSWNDVLIGVCEVMMLAYPYKVAKFHDSTELNKNGRQNFSYSNSDIIQNKKQLSNGLWVAIPPNTKEIKLLCKKIFIECGCSKELKFTPFA